LGHWGAFLRTLMGSTEAITVLKKNKYDDTDRARQTQSLQHWHSFLASISAEGWSISGHFLCKPLTLEHLALKVQPRLCLPLVALMPIGRWENATLEDFHEFWNQIQPLLAQTEDELTQWAHSWSQGTPVPTASTWPDAFVDVLTLPGEVQRSQAWVGKYWQRHVAREQYWAEKNAKKTSTTNPSSSQKTSSNSQSSNASFEQQRALLEELHRGYEHLFPLARQAGRQWQAFLGPTNSGKTHASVELLLQAEHGLYLAPLRLLAHEVFERLNQQGVPCNLRTGEEHIVVEGARFTAATIEAGLGCQPPGDDQIWDACIIDEIQLLNDRERGWAWSQALFGIPARTMIMAGSASMSQRLERLAHYLQEPITIHYFERKTPLSVTSIQAHPNSYQPQPGDALIVFSRKGVLEWRELLLQKGHSGACIYGNLGPVARRLEAERFRSGEAPFVIATDAIGMGLNLPIKRVVFSQLYKFDGREERTLTQHEILQIAGRAGRFGINEKGEVCILGNQQKDVIEKAVKTPLPTEPAHDPLLVRPPWSWVEQCGHTDLFHALKTFSRLNQWIKKEYPDQPLKLSDTLPDEVIQWATKLDQLQYQQVKIPLKTRFDLLGLPVTKNLIEDGFTSILVDIFIKKKIHVPHEYQANERQNMSLMEMEHASTLYRALSWLHVHFPGCIKAGDQLLEWDKAMQMSISKKLKSKQRFKYL